jgi:hypothetical protein
MVKNFISVTREPSADWAKLEPQVIRAMEQYLPAQ